MVFLLADFEQLLEHLMGDWSGAAVYYIVIPLIAAALLPIVAYLTRNSRFSMWGLVLAGGVGLVVSAASIVVDWALAQIRFWPLRMLNSGVLMNPLALFLPSLILCHIVVSGMLDKVGGTAPTPGVQNGSQPYGAGDARVLAYQSQSVTLWR